METARLDNEARVAPRRRRKRGAPFLIFSAALLSVTLLAVAGGWSYCFWSDTPVRMGSLTVYSLRRSPDRFNYTGRMVLTGPNKGQKWIVDQSLVTLSLTEPSIKGLVSPKIHRLPGLVATRP